MKGKRNAKGSGDGRSSLGKSISNDRARARLQHVHLKHSHPDFDHVAALQTDLGTGKNMNSITHETALEDFIAKAELSGREFTAEKSAARIVESSCVVPSKRDLRSSEELQRAYADRLTIPRAPTFPNRLPPDELKIAEADAFLKWRCSLTDLEEVEGLVLTPFEHNIEIWRQLWRVVKNCDVIVQVVDARNPLLFRSADLEAYVKECDPNKQNVLLVNKADLITDDQLQIWGKYFVDNHIDAIFWSAIKKDHTDDVKEVEEDFDDSQEVNDEESEKKGNDGKSPLPRGEQTEHSDNRGNDRFFIVNTEELLKNLKSRSHFDGEEERALKVAMVGYPNVGKSSTVNKIYGHKKVAVSATPGKTRLTQTLIINSDLTLFDCPGLVMPSLALSTAEMLLHSILSVDNMRDYEAPIALLCARLSSVVWFRVYSVIPESGSCHYDKKHPTANELLSAIAIRRGFMTASGTPDCSRVARMLIKDVAVGKLKFVTAAPGFDQELYDRLSYPTAEEESLRSAFSGSSGLLENEIAALDCEVEKHSLLDASSSAVRKIDAGFFGALASRLPERDSRRVEDQSRGSPQVRPGGSSAAHSTTESSSPFGPQFHLGGSNLARPDSKKHHNIGKKKKLRRVYANLDA